MSGDERLEQKLHETAARLVGSLHSLTRAVVLYEANNDTVVRLVDVIVDTVKGYQAEPGAGALRLQILPDEVFVNGRLLKVDPALYERSTELSARLRPFDVGEFLFEREFAREHAAAFVKDLSAALRGDAGALRREGYGALKLGRARGSAIASFRFEPDRLAVWLYGSLLDMVERLYEAHEAGKAPSLLPLKRSLQLVIDNMREHGAIYLLLAAVQNPRRQATTALTRVAIAVNLVGFGVYLGLPNAELMTLALAGVLGGLTDASNPLEGVRALYRFPGLGESAVPLTLLLFDARSARRGEEAGLPGAILATVEEYVRATSATTRRGGVAPRRALEGLQKGKIKWVPAEVAQAFAAWKGPFPVGSLVELAPEGTAVVVGVGDSPQARRRPVVARILQNGQLGPRMDLMKNPNVEIRGTPDPADAKVVPALHAARG